MRLMKYDLSFITMIYHYTIYATHVKGKNAAGRRFGPGAPVCIHPITWILAMAKWPNHDSPFICLLYINTNNIKMGENFGDEIFDKKKRIFTNFYQNWYFSTKISTFTNFGKSTNFGTFTKVPNTGIFTDFGIGTDTSTGNLRYWYRYQYRNTDNIFKSPQYRYRNTG